VKKVGKVEAIVVTEELTAERRATMRQPIRDELRARILMFEMVGTESQTVTRQLTRVNEIERLEALLDAEVDDD
jgi:hypothetical protein